MNREILGIELKYWLVPIPFWALIGVLSIFPQIGLLVMFLILIILLIFALTGLVAYVAKDIIETIREIRKL